MPKVTRPANEKGEFLVDYEEKVFEDVKAENPFMLLKAREMRQAIAECIAALPEIHYAALWAQILNRVEYGGTRTGVGLVTGADNGYPEIYGGDLSAGGTALPPRHPLPRRHGAARATNQTTKSYILLFIAIFCNILL